MSGGQGGPHVEHRVAACGNSLDGHHLKETVRDGNSGEVRVMREVFYDSPCITLDGLLTCQDLAEIVQA